MKNNKNKVKLNNGLEIYSKNKPIPCRNQLHGEVNVFQALIDYVNSVSLEEAYDISIVDILNKIPPIDKNK